MWYVNKYANAVKELKWISTWWNEQRFCGEITRQLIRHETIFSFHMNNFFTIIENIRYQK